LKRTLLIGLSIVVASCSTPPATAARTTPSAVPPTDTAEASATALPSEAPPPSATLAPPPLRFAVIGDFGQGGADEAEVAALVHGWQPDLVITVGDNNYPSGEAATIDAHIGAFYQDFIYPYRGTFGPGAPENRFFPSLGNHDWYTEGAAPYLDFFTLPGNERYYDFVEGPVHFFALDSDASEPDGVGRSSAQAEWLHQSMEASESAWNVVYFHHPPYSSGLHGSTTWMRWPFAEWGADAVLAGHDHSYERLLVDGIPYIVNGLGGGAIYYFVNPLAESQARYSAGHGAMLVTATEAEITFSFYGVGNELIDTTTVAAP